MYVLSINCELKTKKKRESVYNLCYRRLARAYPDFFLVLFAFEYEFAYAFEFAFFCFIDFAVYFFFCLN